MRSEGQAFIPIDFNCQDWGSRKRSGNIFRILYGEMNSRLQIRSEILNLACIGRFRVFGISGAHQYFREATGRATGESC